MVSEKLAKDFKAIEFILLQVMVCLIINAVEARSTSC
jgi:hypothetical protein